MGLWSVWRPRGGGAFWGLMAEARTGDALALVSHQPFLSELIFHLTGHSMEVKKASCTIIRWVDGAWRFERQLSPAELRS